MRSALKTLLQKLEAIEEGFDGLGDTLVRDHMGEHVRRGFLRPEPGYVARGEYGLTTAADRRVKAALNAFCRAANAAAEREGLTTFEQRVRAFQDPSVTTANGADYNAFFGVIEIKPASGKGRKTPRAPEKSNAGKRAVSFEWKGTLDELCAAMNAAGTWQWWVIRQFRVPFMETHPGDWLWGKVVHAKKPAKGFMAIGETEADSPIGIDDHFAALEAILDRIPIRNRAAADPEGR